MTLPIEQQVRALRESCGLWLGAVTPALRLTGEDRVRLLNGLVTCEVSSLQPGEGSRGFFTDVRGHILSPVVVRCGQDDLWLELPASEVEALAVHIQKYIVADRVSVSVSAERRPICLLGPGAERVLSQALGAAAVPPPGWHHRSVEIGGTQARVTSDRELGEDRWSLWSDPGAAEGVRGVLTAAAAPAEVVEIEEVAVEIIRVQAGAPRFGIDYGTGNLPQETGLKDAVSYDKGCYLGQEVVARLHYRGQVARQSVPLEIEAETLPAVGMVLSFEGREVGHITSAVRSPLDGRRFALAMVRRAGCQTGTLLQLAAGGTATVL